MPPNNEQADRLEEHGKRLDHVDERLNIHATRFDRVDLVLLGDTRLGVAGLVQNMAEVNKTLHDLLEWRKEVIFYAKMIIVGGRLVLLLMMMILGTMWWPSLWPQVQMLIKLVGGP